MTKTKMTNEEASLLVMEQMIAMSVEETLDRMAECHGSDTSETLESLFNFGKEVDNED